MKHIVLSLMVLMAVALPAMANEPVKKNVKKARRNISFEYRFSDDLKQTADSETRLDKWYRDAKFGAFIHFGVYSTLEGEYKGRGAQHRYSEWIQISGKIPAKEYHQVAAKFNPAEFDADQWAKTFKECGIRYVVITSKHHDGFALFKSMVSDYNIVDYTPFKRDIIKELSEACHRQGLKFGVYYSHAQDWDQPDAPYLNKRAKLSDIHPDLPTDFTPEMDRYIMKKSLPQVEELVKNYELDLIWFDTPAGMNIERARLFSDMVRKYRPDCLINSRLIHSGKAKIEQQYLPLYDYVSIGDKEVPTKKLPLYVESPDSVSSSFGYKTKGKCYYHTEKEMLHRFVHTVCAGGNALINNGPMGSGKLDPQAVRIYRAMGRWLKVNGESIYATVRNPLDKRPEWGDISAGKDGQTLYLHILEWPESRTISLDGMTAAVDSAVYLATGEKADFVQDGSVLKLTLPAKALDEYDTVVKVTLKKSAKKAAASEIEPTWESLAANYKVPQWFVDGKIGVWMHWGIPSAADENRPNDGSHYARRMYSVVPDDYTGKMGMSETLTKWHTERYGHPSEFGYEDLIPLFKAENWDPDALVKFFKDNGARFIMPVACHHDNFDMYDSFHPWNSVKMGPKRDTLKEWKEAAAKHGLKFGVSTHLYWSPRFLANARKYQKPGTPEWTFFNMDYSPQGYAAQDSWNQHWYARCWEIIEKYDPDLFNNDSPYPKIGAGKGLGVKLFTDYINRDLKENNGKQTVVLSFKDAKVDRSAFTYNLERGGADQIKPQPWMWATDLSGGWFYRKTAVNKMTIPVMVGNSVDAISKNGVVMLNVALRGDGTLPEKQAAYLTAFGDFLKINGEGIYGTRPWKSFGEGPLKVRDGRQGENKSSFSQNDIRFTTKNGVLYAFVLAPPTEDIVIKTLAAGGLLDGEITGIELMGSSEKIKWKRSSDALTIQLPKTLPGKIVNGFRIGSK